MGFWIFMLTMNLLLPIVIIAFGGYFIKNAPKEINAFFGYRTSMSMKNKDTWEFAHHYCGKLWRSFGWIMLVGSAALMLFVIGMDEDVVGTLGGVVSGIQLAFIFLSIFITERAMKRTFDSNGNRI